MSIPKDPVILLSYLNTQLRDYYSSFDELCTSLLLEKEQIITILKSIEYEYNPVSNQFI